MYDYTDLLKSEEVVFSQTKNELKGIYENFPKLINVCFYMQQSIGKFEDIHTPHGELQSIAYMHICQLSYTLKVIYELQMKGYYFESNLLIRNVFESLVQLNYFNKHPENIKNHFKKKINMKAMIEEITGEKEKLYDKYSILSKLTHGFIIKDICRTDRESNRTYLGNTYNEYLVTISINWIPPLVKGFINIFDTIFPNNLLSENIKAKGLKIEMLEWCNEFEKTHIEANPEAKEFYKAIRDVIEK